jgi:hypothetical protein
MAAGRAREAAGFLDRHPPNAGPTTLAEPLWLYERARAAAWLAERGPSAEREQAGTEARAWYAVVVQAWSKCDDTLEPAVSRAREFVARTHVVNAGTAAISSRLP